MASRLSSRNGSLNAQGKVVRFLTSASPWFREYGIVQIAKIRKEVGAARREESARGEDEDGGEGAMSFAILSRASHIFFFQGPQPLFDRSVYPLCVDYVTRQEKDRHLHMKKSGHICSCQLSPSVCSIFLRTSSSRAAVITCPASMLTADISLQGCELTQIDVRVVPPQSRLALPFSYRSVLEDFVICECASNKQQ